MGIDYEIECVICWREIVVFVIYGGMMEIGIEEVVEKIVEKLNVMVYVFKILKIENLFELYVMFVNYDEEMVCYFVKKLEVMIFFYGVYSDVCMIYIGGRDEKLEKVVCYVFLGFLISEMFVYLKGVLF